jgi:hypothetical protein
MTRRFLLTILAALTFGAAVIAHPPGQAYACSCVQPGPPAEAAAQSEAVFLGTVAGTTPQANGVLVTFDVESVWKGPNGPQLTLGTAGSSASCGYEFVPGEKYIVYASAQEGQLATGLCTRTALAADAADDLAALGEGQAPNPGVVPPAGEPAAPAAGLPLLPIGLGVVGLAAVAAVGLAFARRRTA